MEQLTRGERFILDWQYDIAGHFYKALAEAISHADIEHLNRVGMGFPDEVHAYRCYAGEPGWWERVREKARGLGWQI